MHLRQQSTREEATNQGLPCCQQPETVSVTVPLCPLSSPSQKIVQGNKIGIFKRIMSSAGERVALIFVAYTSASTCILTLPGGNRYAVMFALNIIALALALYCGYTLRRWEWGAVCGAALGFLVFAASLASFRISGGALIPDPR